MGKIKGTTTKHKRPKVAVDRELQPISNISKNKRPRETASKETQPANKASQNKKSRATTTREAQPTFDKDRFLSIECQERFHTWFLPKSLIKERKIDLDQPEQSPILEVIKRRKWEQLVTFSSVSYSSILKEFCSNYQQERLTLRNDNYDYV
ncbi:uncharacterized protein LOC133307747 [Gastrolobium bilobum]|uniref:uncharacterized protein LOC133307747 n=1 Tax=Gastrolobium bilobum TaxID=150636 RepID=UPI002AB043E7|nr:uncharacterized protein LOC133307747 [Gastrolobium bilobum]